MVNFSVSDYDCEGDMDGSYNAVYARLGTGPEVNAGLCANLEDQSNRNSKATLGISYAEPHFEELISHNDEPLSIVIRDLKSNQQALQAHFQLPKDSAAVQQAMKPCLSLVKAQAEKEKNAIVVACPVTEGQRLEKVDVLSGAAQRPLAADGDNDIGTSWVLTRAVKARGKLSLVCYYGSEAGPAAKANKQILPIPATGSFCVARHDSEDNHLFGRCLTRQGTGY